ncbi:bifunctional hydroxymethylpyrimidine kinase/phosphomethylpyrimidine kinase [Treponema sp. UBA3813]|uniref:bifunctional hydroxymethylpyrimidine kinase/phosphomethylpyrimidine kinase n=1 Tax=Treponema sp. UBA3813 TaxID=1947715 RepID=UPI0025D0F1BF|nr:bifunctional hydroxymethylpyrimidine kinase/phosphomethylpyrimidine kinase [Treponema sp. UBA3813]
MAVMKTALTIAGSDSCGGAGIQADIKTMTMNGVYAMSAVTALTAQNTTGVTGIQEVSPDFLQKQIEAVVTDIFPDAVKTGMVASVGLIQTIASSIKKFSLKNIVVDPVMVATSGAKLISDEAIESLKKELLPLATVITPNIPETEVLLEGNSLSGLDSKGLKITSEKEMEEAAQKIHEKFGCSVLVKGGHNVNDASDFLYGKNENGEVIAKWFKGRRINNPNTHGTGCTLSSAIAANLAKGESLENAVSKAKEYISGALEAGLDLGKGSGPLMHNFVLTRKY